MIGAILGWLTGGGIAAIGKQLNEAYANRLRAETDHEKLEADQNIAQLQARQAVLLAEQGSWRTSWIRPMLALPIVIYINKLIIWDKVLELGTTPDLSPDLWKFLWIVVGAYFLTRSVGRG